MINSEAAPNLSTGQRPPMTQIDPYLFLLHNGARYRTPIDLQVTPDSRLRFLVIGGCLAQPFHEIAAMINSNFRGDFILLNNFDSFPETLPAEPSQYDFQIIHIPLRSIMGSAYFRLPDDTGRHEEFLRQTQEYLARYLAGVTKLNADSKLPTFVLGFLVPQQNPLGRFQPRYDLRNVMHFIERLNMFLATETAKLENAYLANNLVGKNEKLMLGQLLSTEANSACRRFFSRNGFTPLPNNHLYWSRLLDISLLPPRHISLTVSAGDIPVTIEVPAAF